jgi:hypothetical protein
VPGLTRTKDLGTGQRQCAGDGCEQLTWSPF